MASCTATRLGKVSTMTTQAEKRMVFVAPIDLDKDNRVVPRQVVCAEPSPDIALAVSSAMSGSTAINVKGKSPNSPVEIDWEQVAALSKSRVEAVAQMTERLATIQLLRDAQYRACEAYANGAITDVGYGILVSRFGDTMVTLLTEELAAGNFGRSLATLSGTGKSSGSAQKGLQAAVDALLKQQKELDDAKSELADAQKAQGAVPADASDADKKAAEDKVTEKQKGVTEKEAALKAAQEQATIMMQASASSEATTSATGVGAAGDVAKGGVEVARVLEDMQKNYLYKINVDPQVVSCILALGASRPLGEATLEDQEIRAACAKSMQQLAEKSMELLEKKFDQSFELKKIELLKQDVSKGDKSKTSAQAQPSSKPKR